MDTSRLKKFAPAARKKLIEAIGVKLDYVLTARTADLVAAEKLVEKLRKRVESKGRDFVVEEVAYTWFNRLAALRYLDARGWHPFRLRVLTPANEEDTQPELLQQVRQGVIPEDLNTEELVSAQRVNDLLDGRIPSDSPQAEVQRLLVLGVCRYYNRVLPQVFENVDDETELLLPDDLLTEHSIAHGFRAEISNEDCEEVEVLGWLYQFYIADKKDAVMARKKAVPTEDIPAVTQLFTPHWIVRYLVENSLGRLWLRSRPNSRLKKHMPYYIEDPEGQAPADSLTVATPEEIKLLDPACGSGHMLTYAFDLLVKIYEEEGHVPSEIPEKILTHNLFGLEICPRAAQLASFALVCKAREQSRRAFRSPVQPQVMCLRDVVLTPDEVKGFSDATDITFSQDELAQIHQFREHTETFGALIQPILNGEKLAALVAKIGEHAAGDLLVQNTHRKLRLVLDQAEMLSQRYQVVVANPPYMGTKFFNEALKQLIIESLAPGKADAYGAFMVRNLSLVKNQGFVAMITIPNWMFLSSFEKLREFLFQNAGISSLIHNGRGVWGSDFGSCSFVIRKGMAKEELGSYKRLFSRQGDVASNQELSQRFRSSDCATFNAPVADFQRVPGCPIAYWLRVSSFEAFENLDSVGSIAKPRQGMSTNDNTRFVRRWFEVPTSAIGFHCKSLPETVASRKKWFPYNKGGEFRKWFGNAELVVNWENDGEEIKHWLLNNPKDPNTTHWSRRIINTEFYCKSGLTWTFVSTSAFGIRYTDDGFLFDVGGSSLFPGDKTKAVLGLLCSRVAWHFLKTLNPTLNFQAGNIADIPWNSALGTDKVDTAEHCASTAVDFARADWDNFETSWDFRDLPLLRSGDWEVETGQHGGPWKGRTLAESWANYAAYCTAAIRRMQALETENNRLWIDAYGLQDELTPEVPEDEITLARADPRKDVAAFLSYAVGCMMGRYSLDHPGLILANAGDTLEQYFEKVGKSADEVTFLPDDDAIIPITEDDWFEDDAASRVREFLKVTYGKDTVDENVAFIEEALGKDLRKYFTANTGGFYADHLQTYKKRPIYWMFQSPKKHFRALIYLHRYTRDTVNSLLTGYVREFQHKLKNKIDELQDIENSEDATAKEKTAATKALKKANDALKDVQNYERDILLPLAQQRLEIDLDDGVKANYPKFGKALAKVSGLS